MQCPLCLKSSLSNPIQNHKRIFFKCCFCDLIFSDPSFQLSPQEEKARYETHNNDIQDPNYQKFLRPIVDWITESHSNSDRGLDFGAGTGPVVAHLLRELGYVMELYDPFFWPNEKALETTYDFIVSTEVVEHLIEPHYEFQKLAQLLKPGASLFLMTLLHEDQTDLSTWYYLRDPTHRCAYSKKTFEFIRGYFGLASVDFRSERQIRLKRS